MLFLSVRIHLHALPAAAFSLLPACTPANKTKQLFKTLLPAASLPFSSPIPLCLLFYLPIFSSAHHPFSLHFIVCHCIQQQHFGQFLLSLPWTFHCCGPSPNPPTYLPTQHGYHHLILHAFWKTNTFLSLSHVSSFIQDKTSAAVDLMMMMMEVMGSGSLTFLSPLFSLLLSPSFSKLSHLPHAGRRSSADTMPAHACACMPCMH